MEHPLPNPNPTRLPESVTGLVECVRHEIGVIERELEDCYNDRRDRDRDPAALGGEEAADGLEDAIDDGFMCVDLRVLERKLLAWHRLFSPAFGTGNPNPVGASAGALQAYNCNCNCNYNYNYNYTVTPFFAVKCNPDPVVVSWLARTAARLDLPLGFDCASIAELELAREQIETFRLAGVGTNRGGSSSSSSSSSSDIPTTRIVYANPQRAEADLMRALGLFATNKAPPEDDDPTSLQSRENLWLTLDGIEEVYKIATARERFVREHGETMVLPRILVILRIWVPDGHSQVPLGEKFGMRLDQIDSLVGACLEAGFAPEDIIGVSFHCGSGCESVETYLEALEMGRTALAAIDQRLLAACLSLPSSSRCWLLDIGGGFPGADGLDGDEGRFAAAGVVARKGAIAGLSASAPAPALVEEKKDADDTPNPSPPSPSPSPSSHTTVADIAVAVRPVLGSLAGDPPPGGDGEPAPQQEQKPPLTIIAEPGRYFVEGAFALASRIYQKQMLPPPSESTNNGTNNNDSDDKRIRVYRIPHGVQGVFKDVLLCGESFVPQPLQTEVGEDNNNDKDKAKAKDNKTTTSSPTLYPSRVLGPSGDDAEDVVCDSCLLPELVVGDWLVFDRMGAYTLSIASRAGRPVMRYVLGGERRGGGKDEDEDEDADADADENEKGHRAEPVNPKAFW
mmetsp:Transcript_28110/g.65992  ORF Transcript_28110/g.65992 Transcript_28110/m.65992 type:complete len:681 (+) Transcript_28110:263-2305(+)